MIPLQIPVGDLQNPVISTDIFALPRNGSEYSGLWIAKAVMQFHEDKFLMVLFHMTVLIPALL